MSVTRDFKVGPVRNIPALDRGADGNKEKKP